MFKRSTEQSMGDRFSAEQLSLHTSLPARSHQHLLERMKSQVEAASSRGTSWIQEGSKHNTTDINTKQGSKWETRGAGMDIRTIPFPSIHLPSPLPSLTPFPSLLPAIHSISSLMPTHTQYPPMGTNPFLLSAPPFPSLPLKRGSGGPIPRENLEFYIVVGPYVGLYRWVLSNFMSIPYC